MLTCNPIPHQASTCCGNWTSVHKCTCYVLQSGVKSTLGVRV